MSYFDCTMYLFYVWSRNTCAKQIIDLGCTIGQQLCSTVDKESPRLSNAEEDEKDLLIARRKKPHSCR